MRAQSLAITLSIVVPTLLVPNFAQAQCDEGAGLFTKARHLPLVSQSVSVEIAAGEATLELVQVFHNNGPDVGQADYRMHLPSGASIVGFGFWQKDHFLSASLKEKEEAREAHHKAAREGRATGLLKKEDNIHTFSVYPLAAGEQKQIEVTLRLPVSREMGRNHLRLPLDDFLGQPKINTSVLAQVESDELLEEIGVDGATRKVATTLLDRAERRARIAFSTDESVEVWWVEEAPPLLIRADTVPLPEEERDGQLGLQIRVSLNHAGEWQTPYEKVDVLVDASFSMRRKLNALRTLVGRIIDQASMEVVLHGVTEDATPLGDLPFDEAMLTLASGQLGHTSHWSTFEQAIERLGCDGRHRCLVITDPQVAGLDAERKLDHASVIFLGDAHELSTFTTELGESALTFQVESDSRAKLLALADETVLPVMEVIALAQGSRTVELINHQHLRVAEGGMLRLFGMTDSAQPVIVSSRINGRETSHQIAVQRLDSTTAAGRGVRRGVYREVLASLMGGYRKGPDPALKERIVALSLREEIPTAFTSLQVDDPELSLFAIKPGDPLLTVHDEPGLEYVVAWYPFGETRLLAQDPESGEYSDRFLVPRGWRQQLYRVDVFKHFSDGSVRREDVWYQLDEREPEAALHYDSERDTIRIAPSDETLGIGAVTVHLADGSVKTLSPVSDMWVVKASQLGERFTIIVRDYAGNRARFDCEITDGLLKVAVGENDLPKHSSLPRVSLPLALAGGGEHGVALVRDDEGLLLTRKGAPDLRFEAELRSLWLTAHAALGDQTHLFGTQGGDLVRLQCDVDHKCTAEILTTRFA
ncbi:VIT domain-containing protein, partial [Myxococcota bacterium]